MSIRHREPEFFYNPACEFARHTGKVVVIGSLSDIEAIVQGKTGTRISTATSGIRDQ